MSPNDFSDAALVILGHGSTKNASSSAPVYQHAKELRGREVFGEVREAFWKQDPKILDVLGSIVQRRIFIAPLFISDGYFSEHVIPTALGFALEPEIISTRVQATASKMLFYCRPVGSHQSMTGVLLARVAQVLERFPFPRAPRPAEITLFIAGHGTDREENSRQAVERQVELVREKGIYGAVEPIFLEEEPRIGSCYETAKTKNIVVAPYFMSDGLHVQEDLPVMLGEPERIVQQRLQRGQATWRNPSEKNGKLVWLASSVGMEPLVADVVLERVHEAAQWSAAG